MPYYASELQTWTPPTLATLRSVPRWNVVKTDFTMSRLSQRVSYQSEAIRALSLSCPGLTASEWQAVVTLYNNCKGSLIPFKLVLGGETIYCIITALDWERVTPVSYNVNMAVEEVSSAEIIIDV
jgi:hypothetical protein